MVAWGVVHAQIQESAVGGALSGVTRASLISQRGGGGTPQVLGHQPPPSPPSPRGPPADSLLSKVTASGVHRRRRSMGTKGARRKFLATLDPNTILKPNPHPDQLHPDAHPTLSLVLTLPLALSRIEYWDRAGGGRNIG